jgi:hypothetical protein
MKAIKIILVLLVLLVACGGGKEEVEEPEAIGTAWINGIDLCPSSSEYGEQVADGASLWSDSDMSSRLAMMTHGTQVAVLGDNIPGFLYVQYGGLKGFVQTFMTTDYNPADGIQPDPNKC